MKKLFKLVNALLRMEDAQQSEGIELIIRIRELEERQHLLKDRVLLIGKTLVIDREKTFRELQELKKTITIIKEENLRMRELLERVAEQLNNSARKEELMILQRQIDLLRNIKV
ncbi:hypothetical protein HYZ97_03790 [Candidatus Pacearchaeota archaeon]|nr:hypothetical protein [Candidatus Pacearchaeota archaeon]